MNVVNKQLQLNFRQHKGQMRKIGIDFNWGGKRKALQREKRERESNNTMEVSKCHHELHAYSKIYI